MIIVDNILWIGLKCLNVAFEELGETVIEPDFFVGACFYYAADPSLDLSDDVVLPLGEYAAADLQVEAHDYVSVHGLEHSAPHRVYLLDLALH